MSKSNAIYRVVALSQEPLIIGRAKASKGVAASDDWLGDQVMPSCRESSWLVDKIAEARVSWVR
jgi:hypothetical protein